MPKKVALFSFVLFTILPQFAAGSADLRQGSYLETAVDLTAGSAGRHDQYYGLQFGRYNDWKVKIFFSETPHVFTDR